eukprot:1847632-Pyramimonas_sp.AAC.2
MRKGAGTASLFFTSLSTRNLNQGAFSFELARVYTSPMLTVMRQAMVALAPTTATQLSAKRGLMGKSGIIAAKAPARRAAAFRTF